MVAVITGGTRGIGFAVAKKLLEKGFEIIISSRSSSEQADLLCTVHPEKAFFFAADISKDEDIKALAAFAEEKFGGVDLLVNNAGVAPKERKDILEITPEDFDFVNDINLKGTFFVTQNFVPLLAKKESARIVNISLIVSNFS